MKAKDLSISSKVYTVTPDEIISVSIEAIEKINNRIRITIDRYCYDTNEDAEVIETMNDNFFLILIRHKKNNQGYGRRLSDLGSRICPGLSLITTPLY